MSLPQVLNGDNIESWKNKTNEISANIGDTDLLDNDVITEMSPEEDTVSAINAVYSLMQKAERTNFIRTFILS